MPQDKQVSLKVVIGIFVSVFIAFVSAFSDSWTRVIVGAINSVVVIAAVYWDIPVNKSATDLFKRIIAIVKSPASSEEKMVEIERVLKLGVLVWDEINESLRGIETSQKEPKKKVVWKSTWAQNRPKSTPEDD